jgi:hypothetical protein
LFYREGTKLMAVDVETRAAFRPGTPKMQFDKPYQGSYDVAPDGKRFMMFKNAASPRRDKRLNCAWCRLHVRRSAIRNRRGRP